MATIIIALICAAVPTAMYFRNLPLFTQRGPHSLTVVPHVAVLIPARDEALSIRACVDSVLENVGVELECIVLDDHSTDDTAAIVKSIMDPRVRLEIAPPLPTGWSGKQHACLTLAKLTNAPILCFLDADVRLAPNALASMVAFQQASGAALVSGFPRQETGTLLEKILIPLMHFILLGFLPLARMRSHSDVSLGAGCGQWFLTTRVAYEQMGGHAQVKSTFHDGVKLPRAYRRAGMMTDVCDASDLAVCRMYRSGRQVWNGLAKNAREGLGTPLGIWFWTVILTAGQIVPWVVMGRAIASGSPMFLEIAGLICGISIVPRLHAASRFQQSWLGAILHPVGVALLLAIQWYATVRVWLGRPVGWKNRPHHERVTS